MERIDDPSRFQDLCWNWRCKGLTTALVPTMGYFHEGHLSLIAWAREHADKVAVTLFVNPAQFGPQEDLEAYPRNLDRDMELAAMQGVDVLFTPGTESMYLPGHETWVQVPKLAKGLCGKSRPVHFRGVATVVTKLLTLAVPHLAVFGEKDYQQLAIIKRLARDLNMPTRIVGRPIVREEDGLAMSSRNVNLTPQERSQAPELYKGLQLAKELVEQGERDVQRLREAVLRHYEAKMPLASMDYVEFVDTQSLEPVDEVQATTLLAVATCFSRARLIDNMTIVAQEASHPAVRNKA